MESTVISKALELGFIAAGCAPADFSHSQEIFSQWLDSGRGATMQYLFRHLPLRQHPDRLLTEAGGVVMVAARYLPASHDEYYAGYARLPDYHMVIRARLRQLGEFIRDLTGGRARFRVCVDSAPLPEREWAVRAGLGWRGRQGAIVHPRWGCCLFLGAVLTDIMLRSTNSPPADICGNCRLCLKACPNAAIGLDGLLDARRCAAYWTVEHQGVIPAAAAAFVGRRLFGCDSCTAVCPRNPAVTDHAGLFPDFMNIRQMLPEPVDCLALTESDFVKIFRNTPVMRLGLERLQRNAVVALYNQGKSWPTGRRNSLSCLATQQIEELLP